MGNAESITALTIEEKQTYILKHYFYQVDQFHRGSVKLEKIIDRIGQFLPQKIKDKRVIEDVDGKGMITFKVAMKKYISQWTVEDKI